MKIFTSFNLLFRRLALSQCLYLLGIIIYGAMVRATRSGAGCGAHWPLCNGQLLPEVRHWSTAIELGHRLSSGLCLPLALGVAWWARSQRFLDQRVYRCALATVLLVVIEGLLGASLVLLEHVADNVSVYRALSLSAHLLSSNLLLAFALLTWCFSEPGLIKAPAPTCGKWRWLGLAAGAFFISAFSGAFTVLADTLFPSHSVAHALSDSLLAHKHLFVRLRIFHPFMAMAGGLLIVFSCARLAVQYPRLATYSRVILALLLGQTLLGLSNILWPGALALQLGHLFLAELIWLILVRVYAETTRTPQ